MTLSNLKRWDARGHIFSGGSIKYTLVVLQRITIFGMVTQVVDKCVYK